MGKLMRFIRSYAGDVTLGRCDTANPPTAFYSHYCVTAYLFTRTFAGVR
jgi:hypothetical protein